MVLNLSREEKEEIYQRAAESAQEYMKKEGNDLARRIEKAEMEKYPDMSKTRTIFFENISVNYASPYVVLRNYEYQEALARELARVKK